MNYTKLIREARERADKATSGPWLLAERRHPHEYGQVIRGAKYEPIALVQLAGYPKIEGCADAAFIAHARTDVPALCSAVEAQAAEIERLRNGFKAVICNLQGDHTDVALDNCCRALEEKP